ncbi:aminoglycoside adenylyltransferase domain-containing protein [Paenibacillus harenae]|uniref:aminoglycoside adenylyltransferase domain-containing protein n=1 Tax=Paenibacillus harenae TaxID=306543 RepID=UPI000407F7EC|nr:aminoglycoside adenylyltransferase domain-containing protein [Paenibacillus harenae]
MQPALNETINGLLESLLADIQDTLGEKLEGLYVYGSLAWGDFDPDISDIDLLAIVSSDVTEEECEALRNMHEQFANRHPAWNDRIEAQYLSVDGLKTFREKRSRIAVISPGEPLNMKDAGVEWLQNWYCVQQYGKALYGPALSTIMAPIPKEAFLAAVKAYARQWETFVINTLHSRPYQGYAILTLCRALYTLTHGEQTSKRKAAEWFKEAYPEQAQTVAGAWLWRERYRDAGIDHEQTYEQTVRFVEFAIGQLLKKN